MFQLKFFTVFLRPHTHVVLLVAILVATLFHPGLGGGFIFDDKPNITENVALYTKGIDHVSLLRAAMNFPSAPGLRAIPMLSFGLDHFRADSFDPYTYKTTNLAIHLITFAVLACFLRALLLQVGWRETRAFWGGLAIALAWAIHPLQVSSVLYVVQRMQTLATLFLLLALWWYLKMRQAQGDGCPGWREGRWVLLFWLMALASKEDAAIFPACCLALECTVLGFRASSPKVSRFWRYGYLVLVGVALLGFVFWALPKYGSWTTFTGRDFSSYERVLTQGRVLLLYLGQMLWPLPDSMPFYYDDYVVSRSWTEPASTWVSWVLLAGLGILAWLLRASRPLLALGVFWFFAGHFITSNVIGLELVFEHRNHFPLVGIVLAVGDAMAALFSAVNEQPRLYLVAATCILIAVYLGFLTWQRATAWGSNLSLAEKSVELAPNSSRAWVALCRAHYDLSEGRVDSPAFGKAIESCQQGGAVTGSVMALANVVLFKTLRGDVEESDWNRLLERLRHIKMSAENASVAMNMVGNANHGLPLSPGGVLQVVQVVDQRRGFASEEYVAIARFLLDHGSQPDLAYGYLEKAVQRAPLNTPMIPYLLEGLRAEGLTEWAEKLGKLRKDQSDMVPGK